MSAAAETPPLGRRVVTFLSVAGFSSSFAGRFTDPMVGIIARDLDADPHRLALLSVAFALPYALIQPILGPIGDQLGKERIVTICLFVLTLAMVGGALVTAVPLLFVCRVLSGAAAGGVLPLTLATIGERVPMAERQVAISRFLVFTISGQLLGGTVAGLLSGSIGWRGVFLVAALLALAGAGATAWGFRAVRSGGGHLSVADALTRYRAILAVGRARTLFALVFVEGTLIFGLQPYLVTLLEGRGAGGAREAGIVLAGFAAGGIGYTLLVRWMLPALGLSRMLALAGLICAGSFATLALDRAWTVEVGALAALGLGFYMLHNSFQTQVTEVVPQARGSTVALHAFSFFVGQATAPILFGWGLATVGAPASKLALAGAILVFGLVAARLIGRPQPRAR